MLLVIALAPLAACSSARSDSNGGEKTLAPLPAADTVADEGVVPPVRNISLPPQGVLGRMRSDTVSGGRCEVDADCARIERGCCPLGEYVAIPKDQVDAYQASLDCAAVACPLMLVADDKSVAQCNDQTRSCEVVKPRAIACNGFTPNPHTCPERWSCQVREDVTDVPGVCVQMCGGFANLQCDLASDRCIDDPGDSCDPSNGGADCGGVCVPDVGSPRYSMTAR
jgi:hypothetical protein